MYDELAKLKGMQTGGVVPDGYFLTALVVRSKGDIASVTDRTANVLATVLEHGQKVSASVEAWRRLLPSWFVEQCAPEITKEDVERRRQLSPELREALAKQWSLGGWLYWFEADRREWKWWRALAISPTEARVELVVPGIPFPWGALEWLLRCAGASDVESED
jgi:hypothetical protein